MKPTLADGAALDAERTTNAEASPQAPAASTTNEAAVGAVLDELRSFRHNWWAPILLGFIMLFDSWDSIAIAYAMPTLSAEWRLDPLSMGYIISAGYGGQFIGAIFLGSIAERTGRIPTFIGAAAIMCLLAIASGFAHDYITLLALRFVQGITIGGALPVAITYINELAPTKTRGRYFGLFQTLAISGFAAASVASQQVIPHLGWRWMLGLGAFPIVLLPLVWMTLPESPRWLVRNGRLDAANRALAKLGGRAAAFTAEAPPKPGQVAEKVVRPSVLTLATPAFRARTITVTLLWFLTMFVSFGLTTWVPSIYVKVFHIPVERTLSYTATASLIFLALLAISGFLIDKFGRRPVAVCGLLVTAAALVAVAALRPANELLLVATVITGQCGILFAAVVVWPFTAETYPTSVRALGLGYGSSIGRGASMLTPIFVGFVLAQGAPIGIVFSIFGLFALLALIVWVTLTRETAGKPLATS